MRHKKIITDVQSERPSIVAYEKNDINYIFLIEDSDLSNYMQLKKTCFPYQLLNFLCEVGTIIDVNTDVQKHYKLLLELTQEDKPVDSVFLSRKPNAIIREKISAKEGEPNA